MLQTQWKLVRDRYVRERRKRKLISLNSKTLIVDGQSTSMAGEPFLLRDFVKAETAHRRRFGSRQNALSEVYTFLNIENF